MTHFLPKDFKRFFKKFAVAVGCLLALTAAKAQPSTDFGTFAYLNTCANGHKYYISKTLYTGTNIVQAVANAKTQLAAAGYTIPSANVYAAAIKDTVENDCIAKAVQQYNKSRAMAGDPAYLEGDPNKNGLITVGSGGTWGLPQDPWIGFTDDPSAGATETHFIWSNGQPVCWKNWNVYEPNNYDAAENFTQMLLMEPYNQYDLSGNPPLNNPFGKWNDYFNTSSLPVIIEVGAPETCGTPPPPPVCTLTVTASVPALSCDGPNVIYLGYGPHSVTATSNQTGTTFKWYMLGNSTAISTGATFTPTCAGTYYVVATNGNCTATTKGTTSQIKVIDIRCCANQVYVCHKMSSCWSWLNGLTFTICVPVNEVAAHLAHGDCLGKCANCNSGNDHDNDKTTLQGDPSMTIKSFDGNLDRAFAVSGYPNPSQSSFTLKIAGLSTQSVSIRVTDVTGRLIEQRTNIPANQTLQIGNSYRAGMYFVEAAQGMNKQQIKLVKQ